MATPISFISSLSKNPIILHYFGFGITKQTTYRKEPSLLLENEDGSGQFVTASKLKMIMESCNASLEVVFVTNISVEGHNKEVSKVFETA